MDYKLGYYNINTDKKDENIFFYSVKNTYYCYLLKT